MEQPAWNFEQQPYDEPPDETSINLRAYFDRMTDDKLRHVLGENARKWFNLKDSDLPMR